MITASRVLLALTIGLLLALVAPAVAAAPDRAWRGIGGVYNGPITVYGYGTTKVKVVSTPQCDKDHLKTIAIGKVSKLGRFKITTATLKSAKYTPEDVVVEGRVTKAKVTGSFNVRYARTGPGAPSCSYGPDPFVAKRLTSVPKG